MKFKYKYPSHDDSIKIGDYYCCARCSIKAPLPNDNRMTYSDDWFEDYHYTFSFETKIGTICVSCIEWLENNDPDFALGMGVTE